MQDILGAMAADIRNASGNENAKVGIWLHLDEHQLYYDKVKVDLGLDEAKMLELHKDFLYPAVRILSSGWCFNNNIFFVPFFTGTNHYCLKKLIIPTGHRREYIQLGPLSPENSRTVFSKNSRSPHDVDDSWLKLLSPGGNLSPFDILCREGLNVPRYIEELGKRIIGDELKSPYTSEVMIALLQKIDNDSFFGVLTGTCRYAALASICGMKLPESEWEQLGYHDSTPYAIFEQVGHSYRLLISPAVLAKSAEALKLPKPFSDFLNNPVPAPAMLPLLWEEVVAFRFSAVLTVQRRLGNSSITLADLLGPHFYPIIDGMKHFNTNFRMPASAGTFLSVLPLFKSSTNPEENIVPIMEHLKSLVTKEKYMSVDFTDTAIGMFNTKARKKHPLADIIVALEENPFKVMLMFVSVKGPEEIATSGSRLLSQLEVKRDLQALHKLQSEFEALLDNSSISRHVHVSLVYVLSKEQSENELRKFCETVSRLKYDDISLAVVSDMSTFLPPFAHRLSYLTEKLLIENIGNTGEEEA